MIRRYTLAVDHALHAHYSQEIRRHLSLYYSLNLQDLIELHSEKCGFITTSLQTQIDDLQDLISQLEHPNLQEIFFSSIAHLFRIRE